MTPQMQPTNHEAPVNGVQQRDSLYSHNDLSFKCSPAALHPEDCEELPEEFRMTDATEILQSTEAPELKFRRLEKAYLELMLMNEQLITYLKKSKLTIQKLKRVNKSVEKVCTDDHGKKGSRVIDSILRLLSESWMERNAGEECTDPQTLVVLLEATLAENRTFKGSAKALTDEITNKNMEITDLNRQLMDLKASIYSLQSTLDVSAKETDDIKLQLSNLQRCYNSANEQLRLQGEHTATITQNYANSTKALEDKLCTFAAENTRLIEERDNLRQQNESLLADVGGLQTKLNNAKSNVCLLLAQHDEEIEHLTQQLQKQNQMPNEYALLLEKYNTRGEEVEYLNNRLVELEQSLFTTQNAYEKKLKESFTAISEGNKRLDEANLELLHTKQELQSAMLKSNTLMEKLQATEVQAAEAKSELKTEIATHKQILIVLEDQLKTSAAELQALQRVKSDVDLELIEVKKALQQAQNETMKVSTENSILSQKLEQLTGKISTVEEIKNLEGKSYLQRISALELQLQEALNVKGASEVAPSNMDFDPLQEAEELFIAETASRDTMPQFLNADALQEDTKGRLIEVVARLTLELSKFKHIHAQPDTRYTNLDPSTATIVAGLAMQLDSAERSIHAFKEQIDSLISEITKLRNNSLDQDELQPESAVTSHKSLKRNICGQMVVKKSKIGKSRTSSRRSSITSLDHSDPEFSVSDPGDGDVIIRARNFLDAKNAKDLEIQRLKDKLTSLEEQLNITQLTVIAKDGELIALSEKNLSLNQQYEILSINYERLVEQHEKTVLNATKKMQQQKRDNSLLVQELDLLKAELNNIMQTNSMNLVSTTTDSPFGTGLPPRQLGSSPIGHQLKSQLQRSLNQSHTGDISLDESKQYSMSIEDRTHSQMEEDDLPLPAFPAPAPGSRPYVEAPRRVLRIEHTGSTKVMYEDVELSDSDEYELVNIYSDLTVIEEELLGMVTMGGSTICEDTNSKSQSISTTTSAPAPNSKVLTVSSPDDSITAKVSGDKQGCEEEFIDNLELNKAFQDIKLLKKNITRYALTKEKHIRKLYQKLEQIGTTSTEQLNPNDRNEAAESANLRMQAAIRPDQTTDIAFLQSTILRLEEEKAVLSDNYNNMECIAKELMNAQTSQERLIDSLNDEVASLRQRVKEQSATIATKIGTIESLTECISRHGEQFQQTSTDVVKERDMLIEEMKKELKDKNDEIRYMQETIANMEASHKLSSAIPDQNKYMLDENMSISKKMGDISLVLRTNFEKIMREKTEYIDHITNNIIDLQSQFKTVFSQDKLTLEGLLHEKNALQTSFDLVIADLRREQESFMDINDIDCRDEMGFFSALNSYHSPMKSSKLHGSPFHAFPIKDVIEPNSNNLKDLDSMVEKSMQTSAISTIPVDIEMVQRSVSPGRPSTVHDGVSKHTDLEASPGNISNPSTTESEIELYKVRKELSIEKANLELATQEHEAEVRRLKGKIQSLHTDLLELEETHEQEVSKLRTLVAKLRDERAIMLEAQTTESLDRICEKCKDREALLLKLSKTEAELNAALEKVQEFTKEEDFMMLSRSVLTTSSIMHEKGIDSIREQYEQEVLALKRQIQRLTTSLAEQKQMFTEEILAKNKAIEELEKELEKMMLEVTEAKSASSAMIAEAIAAQRTETTAIITAMEKENKTLADLNIKLNGERQTIVKQLAEKDETLAQLNRQLEASKKQINSSDETSVVALKLQLKSAQDKNKIADRRILDQSSVIVQLRADNERLRRATTSAGKGDKLENERLKIELVRVQSTFERTIRNMNEEAQHLLSELATLRAEHTVMKRETTAEIERLKKELSAGRGHGVALQRQGGPVLLPDLEMAAKRTIFELSETNHEYSLNNQTKADFTISNVTANSDELENKFDKVILEITNAIEMRNTLIETLRNSCDDIKSIGEENADLK